LVLKGFNALARAERERGTTMNVHTIDWNSMPWERVREGVERKAFSGEGATVSLNRLQPGHEPRPHSHPNEQIAYILEGTMDFHIGEETVRVSGGGLLVVPPNVEHWGVVVGDVPVLNLDVFTPKRSEYAA
jgi:quercetin dioxygenase-like cupin family protein